MPGAAARNCRSRRCTPNSSAAAWSAAKAPGTMPRFRRRSGAAGAEGRVRHGSCIGAEIPSYNRESPGPRGPRAFKEFGQMRHFLASCLFIVATTFAHWASAADEPPMAAGDVQAIEMVIRAQLAAFAKD